jgi:4-aminobutyrate aminotransferase-like enzyme
MTTRQTLALLSQYESRNVTFLDPDGSWPIVWDRAQGVHVWDAEGKKYLDLTAAFGVAAAGHANPSVVRAGQQQITRLLHAMGDVHPHALKAQLARELSRITFERWSGNCRSRREEALANTRVREGKARLSSAHLERPGTSQYSRSSPITAKSIFCNSGFEAVEAALKTAILATGKPGIIAFEGAYHGLGYGALNATHRQHFRSPFQSQLREFGHFVPFPNAYSHASLTSLETRIQRLFRQKNIGAVLVEPIQVRGGINLPPANFLPLLRQLCSEHNALLILDEIYTGFGRTGKWFACEHSAVIPDLICLGKALTGGFPLSACVGRADLMDSAWPPSTGEAIHTSTFLGHPVGCAMALAQIREIESRKLIQRSLVLGKALLSALTKLASQASNPKLSARGLGLLAGLEFTSPNGKPDTESTLRILKAMLHAGFILLPEGEHANILSFTPPLTISKPQIENTVEALRKILSQERNK